MEKLGRNSFHYLLFFFLSYYFFVNRVVITRLYSLYGEKSYYWIVGINLLLPLLFFLTKPLNYVKEKTLTLLATKSYSMSLLFLVKIMTTTYLIFTAVITLQITSSVLVTFYYNTFSILFLILTILLSVFYVSRKGLITSNALSVFILIFCLSINIVYVLTGNKIQIFNLVGIGSNTIEVIRIVLMLLFYVFEFALLFLVSDNITTKISKKQLFFFIAGFSVMSIYEATVLTGTFGSLLKMIPYPYYESWKMAGIERVAENVGFLAFLYIYFLCFQRISFSTHVFNKLWANTSKLITSLFLGVIGIGAYLLATNYNMYYDIIDDLFDCSLMLIIVISILLFFVIKKGRKRENEGLRSTIS